MDILASLREDLYCACDRDCDAEHYGMLGENLRNANRPSLVPAAAHARSGELQSPQRQMRVTCISIRTLVHRSYGQTTLRSSEEIN